MITDVEDTACIVGLCYKGNNKENISPILVSFCSCFPGGKHAIGCFSVGITGLYKKLNELSLGVQESNLVRTRKPNLGSLTLQEIEIGKTNSSLVYMLFNCVQC